MVGSDQVIYRARSIEVEQLSGGRVLIRVRTESEYGGHYTHRIQINPAYGGAFDVARQMIKVKDADEVPK